MPKIKLAIPEEVLTRLIDPAEVFGCAADEGDLDAALGYRIAMASAEVAEALVATGRPLSYLHVLWEAIDLRAQRRGCLQGALSAGRIAHALASDGVRPVADRPQREATRLACSQRRSARAAMLRLATTMTFSDFAFV